MKLQRIKHALLLTLPVLIILLVIVQLSQFGGITGFLVWQTSSQSNFDEGTYTNSSYNATGGYVSLNYSNKTGNYTSKVFNAGSNSTWNNISWTEGVPYGEELPDNKGIETVLGGANMTGNVLLMHFNNDSAYGENNTFAYDFSGENNNASINGAPTLMTGKFRKARNLDGTNNQFFDIPDNFGTMTNATISMWIKFNNTFPTDYTTGVVLFSDVGTGSTGAGSVNIIFDKASGKAQFGLWGAGWNFADSTKTIWNAQTWYHITAVLKAVGGKELYVDGVLEGTNAVSTNINFKNSIIMGKDRNQVYKAFNGTTDEVTMFNRSLSATEILDHYKRGALELNITTRSCDDSACSGEPWNETYTNSTFGNLSNVSANQYFQYRANFETDNENATPELYNVTIDYTVLNTKPTITLNFPNNNTYYNSVNGSQTVNFNFTATDDFNTTLNCSIYFANTLNQTNSSVQNNTATIFTISNIPLGNNYTWYINCSDEYPGDSLSNVSETRVLTVMNLTVNCEAGGPYQQEALVLTYGNVTNGTHGLANQIVNLSVYDSSNTLNTSKNISTSDNETFETSFSGLEPEPYTLNASTTFQGFNSSCADSFQVGGSASLVLDKIASVLSINNTAVVYNITLRATNKGGANSTNTNITDTDSASSPYSIGTLQPNTTITRTYNLTFARNQTNENVTLVVATTNGVDAYNDAAISADTGQIDLVVPGTESGYQIYGTQYATLESINNTTVKYRLHVSVANPGSINVTGIKVSNTDWAFSNENVGTLEPAGTHLYNSSNNSYTRNETDTTIEISGTTIASNEVSTHATNSLNFTIPKKVLAAQMNLDRYYLVSMINNTTMQLTVYLDVINTGDRTINNLTLVDGSNDWSITNLSVLNTVQKDYTLNLTRNSSTYTYTLSGASVNGTYDSTTLNVSAATLNVSVPSNETGAQLTLTKNIQYNSETTTTVNYTITDQIVNSGGQDLTDITFQDSDIGISGISAIVINLSKGSSYSVSNYTTIDKAASNTNKTFVKATATWSVTTWESNQPKVRIPGYGGPADVTVDAPASVSTSATTTSTINVTNQNPDIGQDFTIDYWITSTDETTNYTSGQKTIYVAASSTNSTTASLTAPSTAGTYRFKALVTWAGGTATAYDSFTVSAPSEAPSAGAAAGGAAGGAGAPSAQTYTLGLTSEKPTQNLEIKVSDSATFKLEEVEHKIVLNSIIGSTVTITISSSSITLTLFLNQPKYVDLDSDLINDLKITLKEVTKDTAKIEFTLLKIEKEKITGEIVPVKEAENLSKDIEKLREEIIDLKYTIAEAKKQGYNISKIEALVKTAEDKLNQAEAALEVSLEDAKRYLEDAKIYTNKTKTELETAGIEIIKKPSGITFPQISKVLIIIYIAMAGLGVSILILYIKIKGLQPFHIISKKPIGELRQEKNRIEKDLKALNTLIKSGVIDKSTYENKKRVLEMRYLVINERLFKFEKKKKILEDLEDIYEKDLISVETYEKIKKELEKKNE